MLVELTNKTNPENKVIHLYQGKTKLVLNLTAPILKNGETITTKSSGGRKCVLRFLYSVMSYKYIEKHYFDTQKNSGNMIHMSFIFLAEKNLLDYEIQPRINR